MTAFPEFLNDEQQLLKHNNLESFDKLWELKAEWFEEPNYRRNGWSGVNRIVLPDAQGQEHALFLKRQENHNHRSLLHPITGIPTFRREFINFRNLKKADIPTLEPIYYGERKNNDGYQAIIITKALENYVSLEDYFNLSNDSQEIEQILKNSAKVVRKLHNANFRHGCLYPKHIFVCTTPGTQQYDIRLIDLEKLRWLPIASALMLNDISRLIRRRQNISVKQLQIFLDCYLQGPGKNRQKSKLARKLFTILEKQKLQD